MFSDNELKLINSPSDRFPLLAAASRTIREAARCNSCSRKRFNEHTMLRVAVNKYKSDKEFIQYCSSMFKLPCVIAGVTIS